MAKVSDLLRAHGKPEREVYLDNENSGRVPKEVVDAMAQYYLERGYGHPSITNKPGWEALEIIEETSELLRRILNASDGSINFVHSGTEANNLAILGTAKSARGRKIIVSDVEHFSVLLPAQSLADHGFEVIRAPVDGEGFVDVDVLAELVDKETHLVSVQLVNHEIGTIQPIKAVVETVKERNPSALVHVDACDALGRMRMDVSDLGVDMLSLSSHKVWGPKGVGVLYVREGVRIEPILRGALSSQPLWPGVENVPAIAGFKKALELFAIDLEPHVNRMREMRDYLIEGILSSVPESILNGPAGDRRVADNVNISFLRVEGEAITVELSLRGVYVSSGSACTSRVLEPSHVMLAIGREYEEAHGSILFKLSPFNSMEEMPYVVRQVRQAIGRLRELSPLKGRGESPSD